MADLGFSPGAFRITGPLGGANFLSPQDYTTGLAVTNRIGAMPIGALQQGLDARNTMIRNEAGQIAVDEARRVQQQRQQAEDELRQNREIAAEEYGLYGPDKQANTNKQIAAITAERQNATSAPVQAPAAQQTVVPLPGTIGAQAPAMQPLPPEDQQPSSAAPEPAVQQTAVAPQVATPATPAAAVAPATPAPAAPAATGFDPAALRAQYLEAAKGATQKDIDLIKRMVADGRVTPRVGAAYLEGLGKKRLADVERTVKLETDIAAIEEKSSDAGKKRMEKAKLLREYEDDSYNEVLSAFKSAGPVAADAVAKENGITVDFNNPTDLKLLESRAKRSPSYKAQREEARKDEDAAAKQLGLDSMKDLPPGIRPVVGNDREGNKVVRFVDADGNFVTQAQVNALVAAKAKAGATRVGGAGAGAGAGGTGSSTGGISGIKVDKQGNRNLDPGVAKDVGALANAAQAASKAIQHIDEFTASGALKKAPSSLPGRAVASVQSAVGYEGDLRMGRERFDNFLAKMTPLVSADNPMLKGGVNLFEAKQALKSIADPDSSETVREEAVLTLRRLLVDNVTRFEDAVSKYDDETKAKLGARGKGVDATTPQSSQAEAGKPPVIRTQAEYDALPAGTKYVDSKGTIATKR